MPRGAAKSAYSTVELDNLAAAALRGAAEEGLTLLRSASSTSGYRGVLQDSSTTVGLKNPFRAQVRRNGRRVTLGRFATAEEAALCYARSPEGSNFAMLAAFKDWSSGGEDGGKEGGKEGGRRRSKGAAKAGGKAGGKGSPPSAAEPSVPPPSSPLPPLLSPLASVSA
mmetsp:Transcript_49276/g.164525  ORF Transcript_49276/g.164525 Transcript_49276/m.164525 type:complete len:168 (+) Transcript_49276:67-570(+)